MATKIKTSILIKETPQKVWATLTNFNAYRIWNPFINLISGKIIEGGELKVRINGTSFKPKILVVETNKKLEWKGKLILPRVFDGQHLFELIDNGDNTTTFKQSEKFSGILVPLFRKKILKEVKGNFIKMNNALKQQVEKNIN